MGRELEEDAINWEHCPFVAPQCLLLVKQLKIKFKKN